VVIFSYTGSPKVKISQKVLGGLLFLTHTVYIYIHVLQQLQRDTSCLHPTHRQFSCCEQSIQHTLTLLHRLFNNSRNTQWRKLPTNKT